MKIKLVILLLILSIGYIYSQGKVTFSTETPKVGDNIKIKYDPSGSKLETVKEIYANILSVKEMESPVWQEVKLVKKGKEWSGEFKIKEKDTRLLLIKFVSDKLTDDNNENVWDILVYGKNKKPLNSAYESRGAVYFQGDFYGFKKKKDLDMAVKDFEAESKLYPDSWRGQTILWKIWMRRNPDAETTSRIKSSADMVYEKNKNNENALLALIPLYEQFGEKEKSGKIKSETIAKNPKGKIAQNNDARSINNEKDRAKRNGLLEKLLVTYDYKNYEKIDLLMSIISFYTKEKNWIKVEEFISSSKPEDGRLYAVAAARMINDSSQLEKGINYARKGSELLLNPANEMKPPYMSRKEWREECNYYLYDIKHALSLGLIKKEKYDEAEKILEEIYSADSEDKTSYAETLIGSYIKSGKIDKAFNISKDVIAKNGSTEEIAKLAKTVYIKQNGSDTGFDSWIDGLKNSAKKGIRSQLMKELINKPAPNFELKGMDGKVIKLSDLKGKIVVVDFWATWCGPCKASFPFLQKVYEKYKSNPDIVILALNTWERVKGEEKEKAVKKFIDDNKYTFTVLYDENFVEQYGVTGIPTKFIIDKDGMIQFQTIGFSGGDKMMDEMDMQFDILLKGEHKK